MGGVLRSNGFMYACLHPEVCVFMWLCLHVFGCMCSCINVCTSVCECMCGVTFAT